MTVCFQHVLMGSLCSWSGPDIFSLLLIDPVCPSCKHPDSTSSVCCPAGEWRKMSPRLEMTWRSFPLLMCFYMAVDTSVVSSHSMAVGKCLGRNRQEPFYCSRTAAALRTVGFKRVPAFFVLVLFWRENQSCFSSLPFPNEIQIRDFVNQVLHFKTSSSDGGKQCYFSDL